MFIMNHGVVSQIDGGEMLYDSGTQLFIPSAYARSDSFVTVGSPYITCFIKGRSGDRVAAWLVYNFSSSGPDILSYSNLGIEWESDYESGVSLNLKSYVFFGAHTSSSTGFFYADSGSTGWIGEDVHTTMPVARKTTLLPIPATFGELYGNQYLHVGFTLNIDNFQREVTALIHRIWLE